MNDKPKFWVCDACSSTFPEAQTMCLRCGNNYKMRLVDWNILTPEHKQPVEETEKEAERNVGPGHLLKAIAEWNKEIEDNPEAVRERARSRYHNAIKLEESKGQYE
jgi:hypothetical protein